METGAPYANGPTRLRRGRRGRLRLSIVVPAGGGRHVLAAKGNIARDDAAQEPSIHVIGFQVAVLVGDPDDASNGLADGAVDLEVVLRSTVLFASSVEPALDVLCSPAAADDGHGGLHDRRVGQMSLIVVALAGRGAGVIRVAHGGVPVPADADDPVNVALPRIDDLDHPLGQESQDIRVVLRWHAGRVVVSVHLDDVGDPDMARGHHGDVALDDLAAVVAGGIAAQDDVAVDEDLSAWLGLGSAKRLSDVGIGYDDGLPVAVGGCVVGDDVVGIGVVPLELRSLRARADLEVPRFPILVLPEPADTAVIRNADLADAPVDEELELGRGLSVRHGGVGRRG